MIQSLPPGLKFLPTDREIILNYLFRKANGLQVITLGGIIDDCDIYGDEKIWMKMFLETNKKEVFFFSKLRKKFDHGMRMDRSSLNGTWKESHSKTIKSENKIIGTKHFFNFIPKKGFCVEERWLMNEFRIAGDLIKSVKDASFVVCRISCKNALRSRMGVEKQNPEGLRFEDVTVCPLSSQNNYESFGPATMLQTATTETTQQVEALTDGTDTDDLFNGLCISPEELRELLSSP